MTLSRASRLSAHQSFTNLLIDADTTGITTKRPNKKPSEADRFDRDVAGLSRRSHPLRTRSRAQSACASSKPKPAADLQARIAKQASGSKEANLLPEDPIPLQPANNCAHSNASNSSDAENATNNRPAETRPSRPAIPGGVSNAGTDADGKTAPSQDASPGAETGTVGSADGGSPAEAAAGEAPSAEASSPEHAGDPAGAEDAAPADAEAGGAPTDATPGSENVPANPATDADAANAAPDAPGAAADAPAAGAAADAPAAGGNDAAPSGPPTAPTGPDTAPPNGSAPNAEAGPATNPPQNAAVPPAAGPAGGAHPGPSGGAAGAPAPAGMPVGAGQAPIAGPNPAAMPIQGAPVGGGMGIDSHTPIGLPDHPPMGITAAACNTPLHVGANDFAALPQPHPLAAGAPSMASLLQQTAQILLLLLVTCQKGIAGTHGQNLPAPIAMMLQQISTLLQKLTESLHAQVATPNAPHIVAQPAPQQAGPALGGPQAANAWQQQLNPAAPEIRWAAPFGQHHWKDNVLHIQGGPYRGCHGHYDRKAQMIRVFTAAGEHVANQPVAQNQAGLPRVSSPLATFPAA